MLAALRSLSADPGDDVRSWATFGLAESDARDEAIGGLARRLDSRATALVERELARPRDGRRLEDVLDLLEILN